MALFFHVHSCMYVNGVLVEPVSVYFVSTMQKALPEALTCIHHKPPVWEGMSQGALPRYSVSKRRHASAVHGWMTWRSDH